MAADDYSPRPAGRPRTKSMLSFGSHKSGDTPNKPKIDLIETARDKTHRRMTSKADPSMAINEQQPGQAAFDKTTLESLRGMQHKDAFGNLITDPDASNPTRPRLERPLDTIRSFHDAADGQYRSKSSARPGTSDAGFASRRSSYYQSPSTPQPRLQNQGGYGYGGHPAVTRNYAYGGERPSRPGSYIEGYGNTPPPVQPHRRLPPRNQSDPMLYGNPNSVYGNNHYQSHESATSGSGSGYSHGTDAWGNSTDPSSENSSVDRAPQAPPPPPKPDLGEQYGFSGFGNSPDLQQNTILEEGGYYQNQPYDGHEQASYSQQGYGQQGYGYNGYPHDQNGGYVPQGHELPPPPPPHSNAARMQPRAPSKLQSARRTSQYDEYGAPERSENAEKRKSWLKRRFSKNG